MGSIGGTSVRRSSRSGESLFRELTLGDVSRRSSVIAADKTGDDLSDWWNAYLEGRSPYLEAQVQRRHIGVVELFCGPGRLALGFDQACSELGFESKSLAAVDQDAGALAIYQRNHGVELTVRSQFRCWWTTK